MSTAPVAGPRTWSSRGWLSRSAGAVPRRGGRGIALAVIASAAAVAFVTVAIDLLQLAIPVLSLGVLYLFAVLPVAAAFGLGYAVAVSFASMLAFNFFFLPPLHTLTLADSANWLALAVYVCTSVVVSELATRQRRRASDAEQREREAAALTAIAARLLGLSDVVGGLPDVGRVAGDVLGVPGARITLEPAAGARREDEIVLPLSAAERAVGYLTIPSEPATDPHVLARFLPAVGSMLAMAIDRQRLTREVADAEVLRQSDAVKTAVLRAVSHDLRSPLTAIRVAGDNLAAGSHSLSAADHRDLVEAVRVESRRLERMVGNLLDLSRLQAGAAAPNRELWPADALAEQALAELGERGAGIRVDLPEDLPVILADAGHVRRALVNLLDNALAASPPDQAIWIRARATPEAVELLVVDAGPGVAPADAKAIFEPFQRGATVAHDGSGLGLAIVRGFAEANGGTAWVETPAKGGACFVLALPRVPSPPE